MTAETLAPAKINLFLHVGAPGADGYHPLCSLMVFADLGDRLSMKSADALALRVEGEFAADLAHDDDNLVLKAAHALLAQSKGPQAPKGFTLRKALPVASGLGGGSSDAGATLRLLREAVTPRLDDAALEAVAAGLGADGAACLWGKPTLAQGRGEQLSPAPGLPLMEAVLVNGGFPVSTAGVYAAFDDAGAFGSVIPPPMPETFESVEELASWLAVHRNDLEAAAIAVAPGIGDVLVTLGDEPEALLARVSGSGGTCFALCAGDLEADALADRIAAMRPEWWVRRCRLGGPWE